jgi:hypothetical protein
MRFFERRLFISSTACSLSVAMRIIAAVVGGYALAHSLPIAIAAVMPITKAEAALFAIQGSFLVYTAAVIWVFAARNARAAWLGLLVPTALTGLVAWGFL